MKSFLIFPKCDIIVSNKINKRGFCNMAKLTVKDVDLKGKKVLVRVDFNVPLKMA